MNKANKNEFFGYTGRILRVDLSDKEISYESIPMDYIKKFLGGEGIATKILYDEVPPEVKPFDPQNRLIISTGPFTGTLAPSSARSTLTTRSPLTNIFGNSNFGGFFAAELKWAGYDHIIIKGKSPKPIYIWINNDEVEIRDARHLWGRTTWESDKMIREELGDPGIQIACIGPAGENLSLTACLIANKHRAAGRGGLGAVFGSKNLKAIAARGTKGVKIADPQKHMKICHDLFGKIARDPLYPLLSWGGTPGFGQIFHLQHLDIPKYGTTEELYWDDFDKLSIEKIWEMIFSHSKACFNCPTHCGHWCEVKSGPYAGTKKAGFEYNALHNFGTSPCIDDPGFVATCNIKCNQLGMGLDEAAYPILFAMTLFEKGVISEEETGGMKIEWGDQNVILKLLDQIAYREGFGAVLSNGTRKAAQEIGRGSEYYAKHIKGLDAEGDIRMSYGTALSFSVSTRGSDHLQGMPIIEFYDLDYLPEKARDGFMKKIGSIHKPNTRKPEAAPALVAYYNPQMAVFNSLELCQNVTDWVLFYAIRLEDMPPLLAATTNIEFNEEDLRSIGRRIRAVQRAFNARLGIRRNDDIPPDFFFKRPVVRGPLPAKKFVLKKNDYNKMSDKFYELSEYDIKTGIPTKSTLESLDLADVAEDLTKRGIIPG